MRHGATGEIGLGDEDMGNGTWRVPERSRRGRGMDPATRKLALLAVGVGGVLVLGIGAWSMMGHRNTVVPVIQADSRPVRVKPENPGGLQVNGTNDELMSGDGSPAGSRMSAPPEAPQLSVLRAHQAEPSPSARSVKLAVPLSPDGDAPSAAAGDAARPPVSGLPEKHVAAATPVSPKTAPVKGTQVQLAALGSEEAARAEWTHLNKRFPDLLGGRQPSFSKTERDGKTFWRVRTGGFTDMAQATGFCEKARAKGATCSIASY